MQSITLKITNGGDVVLLYSDNLLDQAGNNKLMPGAKMEMSRASNVDWDEPTQRWFVRLPSGGIIGNLDGYISRAEAILEEVRILNLMLEGGEVDELGFQ